VAGEHQKEFIDCPKGGPRVLALQDCELLAESEVLRHQAAMGAKNAKRGSEPEPKEVEHGGKVI